MRGAHLTNATVLFMPAYSPPAGGSTKNYYLGGLAAAGRLRRGLGFLWILWSMIHASFPAV
jgi:hypothetical protein